ncbi:MAG: M23 family metallopeptidase [Flavobacteriales bacterium]
MKKILILLIILFSSNLTFSQDYINPLDFRLLLSGTFGELRGNHFHAGIDFKTKGVEGQNIYAIADGYISRIKVSSYGYGKALYINHPDGKTSVYAHLQKFSKKIDTIVKKEHYKRKQFEINIFPKAYSIQVKQGEIIALSGNSGSSQGAHLHFEIRDTKTEHPLDPLDYGFKVIDNISPILKEIKIFDIDNHDLSSTYKISKKNKKYYTQDTIYSNSKVGIGIYTFDQSNDAYNKNGVNDIKVYIDSVLIYHFELDQLDFSKNKYINAHIDYEEKVLSKRKFHKCFRLPNNSLKNYKTLINNGYYKLDDNKNHLVEIEVSDSYDNISNLSFILKKSITASENKTITNIDKPDASTTKLFYWYNENNFNTDNFKLSINKNYLYETIDFNYLEKDSIKGTYGKIHQCHFETVPLHKAAKISIRANIPSRLKDKVYIAKVKDNKYIYFGNKWENSYLSAKISQFGDFAVAADSIKPKITGVNIYPAKEIKNQTTIKCLIEDKESGIKKFEGKINGQWVLMEYDHKRKLLEYDFNEIIKKGENLFNLEVTDMLGNVKKYSAKFYY